MPAPPKSVNEMTPEECLRSLQEFAEEQRYVQPGEQGTLPSNRIAGMTALAFGGPLPGSGYEGHLAPPSYATATEVRNVDKQSKTPGPLKNWL
jgi:hypothetical protein